MRTRYNCPPWQARNPVHAAENSRDLPKPECRTATMSLRFSKYSEHFTWSGFKQNDEKLQRLKADPSRLSKDSFSRCHLDFGIFDYWNLANYLITPRISGCTMDTWPADARAFSHPASKPVKRAWERDWTIFIVHRIDTVVSLWLQFQTVDLLLQKEGKLFRCFLLPELTSRHIVR